MINGMVMFIIAITVWGGVGWTLFSDRGNRYAEAQKLNIGNCWPVCEPLKKGQIVSYTIITESPKP